DGHLAGVVKIAEGLTASSAALKTGDISFSTEETGTFTPGQGYYDYKTSKPGSQITKEFTTAITGDAAADTVYIEKGVLKDDGTYVFTADSTTITPEKHLIAGGAWLPQISAAISGSDENHNVTIDMNGNKLTVDTATDTHTTGIAAVGKGAVNINNAGAMSVSATSTTNGQTGALFVNAGGTINIHNAGADNVLTLRANSAAPANAAVIKSMNGVSGVMSAITVDGLVDILADKSNASGANEAISAVASKVEIGGGVIKAINGAEYAISAYGEFASKNRGQVNVNVKKDAEGSIIGAGSNNVQMEGNVNLGGGMDSAGASADVSIGLNTKESFWKGDVSNTNGSSAGIVNLYMGNGASWTGNNLSGNTVNADLNNATWTGYSNGNAMHLKLDNSIWNVNGASKLASFSGNNGSIIVANNAGDINVAEYSGNTNVIYNHDADNPTNILGGSFTIGQANTGSNITLITDNQGITKGFNAYDKAEDQNTVNEVLNKLAQKLFYTANDGKLAGTVKIASGLTASSAALKTGDISFSTDATGTKTPGQGFYKYNEIDDTVITDPITGNLDKKYVSLGIETEKGIYNFTQDTTINVIKGDYSSNLSAIESSGGPITINADGKNLDVSYHVLKGSNVARAVATGLSYGKSKDITIKAKSLKLSTDTTGFRAQGVYATGGKITIDADTTITASAQTESNGIYSGSGGTVTMNGNLDIQKDSKAANYIALNSDDNGIINVNVKDGKAGDGIVKIDGDVYTKSAETYDYWEDETTSTSSTVNLALQGKDSSWNGRSLYEVTSGDDSTSYGTFNLWLTDGATWTNEKNGKEVPSGFTGSHVTNFTGGADAAHAGNIFQKDSKNLTIDKYSGNTNIFYAHTGNGEAAADYKAGDTIIKNAAEGSAVSLITDNSGIAMDNEYSIANVLNALAGKLTYSNFVNGENNLTGYVKIADGLTASSKAMQTGDISFSSKDGKGSLKDGSITPGITYPETQTPESSKLNNAITGDAKADYNYKKNGILKEDGSYVFTQDPTKIEVESGAAVDATENNINIDSTQAKLELKGETGINANGADVTVNGNTGISGDVGINAENGNVTLNGSTVISGTDAAINAGENANVNVNGNNSALTINGSINANGGNITVDSGNATGTINGDVNASNGGSVEISLNEKNSKLTGSYNVDDYSSIVMNIKNGATWVLTDDKDEAAGMSLLQMTRGAAPAVGLTVNGGTTESETGYLDMRSRTGKLEIDHYSGWETIIYNHDNKGSEAQEFKSGNTVISNAKEGSGVILFTDSNNININSQAEVEAAMTVLAEKIQYTDHAANGTNLKGKVRIAEGLTSTGKTGVMKWNETTGIGKFDPSSIKWGEIYNGDYETLVMKGVRSAATTSMHSWRDNMQDTYTGADLADEDGIFVKALGGKTSSDVKGVKDDNTYRGVQVGYDKALANGWHAGVAFDYRDGDSNYLLGGKGDNQLYSLGVYGVKSFDDQSYLRVAAKAGRVENEYDVYNEIRSLKLHGDYKANAYGLTMEYGKTFGSEASYFTPKAQLTWSQVGSKDYTAHTPNDSMRIDQDAYSSLVARFGVEAGAKSEKGRVYVGLYGAHEFNGDISASYFAKDGGTKHTSFDGSDTWMEMSIGGSYDLSDNCHIYADFAKDFGGDFERKWKASAGLRFEF
ncbi:autotransporter outer membrane beta-barrel domain-containing protein, partial [Phascolarctobacterium succinatutens]|uniref:autotransporter outer membrane beta-barrel domain-containing protein n=2 Tax=Phascolarctobacterium succinatutens TaxID=626940 RepID=UPI0026E98ACA